MTIRFCKLACAAMLGAALFVPSADAQVPPKPGLALAPFMPVALSVDLMTASGSAAFGTQWRSIEAKIVPVAPIPAALPGYTTAADITPRAGAADFDDSQWPVIDAPGLNARRGGGYLSFIWYRGTLTIPAKIGTFDTAGATVVLSLQPDNYAEVWVNGTMPRAAGLPSPGAIQGFSIPNRLVLSDAARAGDKFQIAILGINGPISATPDNTVFFRQAHVEFIK